LKGKDERRNGLGEDRRKESEEGVKGK